MPGPMINSVPFPSLLPSGSQASADSAAGNGYFSNKRKRFVSRLKILLRNWAQRLLRFDEVSMARFSRIVSNDSDSRKLVIYMIATACLILIKLFVGIFSLNIGLVALALTNVFDCTVLLAALASMVFSRKPSDIMFSYGYSRFEVLSGFTITCFLTFNAFFTLMETLHASITGSLTSSSRMVSFEVLSLLINLLGITSFIGPDWIGKYFGRREYSRLTNGARRINLHAIFTYMICESIFRSVTLMGIFFPNSPTIHFLISISGAILAFCLAYPIFIQSAKVLLQTRPTECAESLYKNLRDISVLEGVLECRATHFWSLTPGDVVGTVHIRARSDANTLFKLKRMQ